MKLRPFVKEDWYGLGGAEEGPNGEAPMLSVGELIVVTADGRELKAQLIADNSSVGVMYDPEDWDEAKDYDYPALQRLWAEGTPRGGWHYQPFGYDNGYAKNVVLAELFPDRVTVAQLIALEGDLILT